MRHSGTQNAVTRKLGIGVVSSVFETPSFLKRASRRIFQLCARWAFLPNTAVQPFRYATSPTIAVLIYLEFRPQSSSKLGCEQNHKTKTLSS
jgi:hypothetical protein